ncbi:unnamed protein product [Ixodes pacificus]
MRGALCVPHCLCTPYRSCGFDTCGFLIENYKCQNYTIEDKERTMLFCPLYTVLLTDTKENLPTSQIQLRCKIAVKRDEKTNTTRSRRGERSNDLKPSYGGYVT